jgi:hypothetical protein
MFKLTAGPTSLSIANFRVTAVTANFKLRASRRMFLLKCFEQNKRDIYFVFAISNNNVIT